MKKTKLELNNIKNMLNDNIKIIDLQFTGIDSDKKRIDISDILRSHSKKPGLPIIEKYEFFDFNYIKDQIQLSQIPNDKKTQRIEDILKLEDEFNKLKDLLLFFRTKKDEIYSKHICGTLYRYKVVYKEDLQEIYKIQEELIIKKQCLNKHILKEALEECKNNFSMIIREELLRHDLRIDDIQDDIDKKLVFANDINEYINKINIDCVIITDISDEMLHDTQCINKLKSMPLNQKLKDMIDSYIS